MSIRIQNDGWTKWIVQRNEKIIVFERQTKKNDLKSFEKTRKNDRFYWRTILLKDESENERNIYFENERNQYLLNTNDEQKKWKRSNTPISMDIYAWSANTSISMDIYAWSATMTDNKPNLGLFYHRAPKMCTFFYKRSWFSNIIISVGALTASCTYSLDRGLLLNLVKFFKLYKTRWNLLLPVLPLP